MKKINIVKKNTEFNNIIKIGKKYSNDIFYIYIVDNSCLYNRYGISVSELKNYNNLTSNLLSIGQILRIPTANEGITYVVKSGDNLYSIANQYNTTVDEIKRKNNLSNNLLNVGQILIIWILSFVEKMLL